MMITEEEIRLVRASLGFCKENGATNARITLTKSTEDLVSTLDGKIDKVTECADRSMTFSLFVNGKYGTFSTNRIGEDAVREFIVKAIDMVRMLAPDECRRLPDPTLYCKTAVTGNELGTYDPKYENVTAEERIALALKCSAFKEELEFAGCRLISEEGEYSDSFYDTFLADTGGMECRHMETNFDYGVEVTVEDRDGNKYSDYWWTSSAFLKDFKPWDCCRIARERATAQIGADCIESGKYNMVIASEAASKVVSPLLRALNAYSIQQGNSFLKDSLGKKVFSSGLTILDCPHRKGESCSKLFDSEGVATTETPIIENGVVREYFINSYMAGKLSMGQTVEDATRPVVMPWPTKGLGCGDLMSMCGDGILVTDFNGGNTNSATGDFSFGISGYRFKDGKIVAPVCGMLVTGNFLTLWNNLLAIADDFRLCFSKLIPTLAFSNADFNGQ